MVDFSLSGRDSTVVSRTRGKHNLKSPEDRHPVRDSRVDEMFPTQVNATWLMPGRGPDGDQDAVRAQMADIGATGPNEGILWSRLASPGF